jgi:hypothetical protein
MYLTDKGDYYISSHRGRREGEREKEETPCAKESKERKGRTRRGHPDRADLPLKIAEENELAESTKTQDWPERLA